MKSSDFDRGRRQQETLRAIYARVLQTGTIARLPALYNDLTSIVETDITLTQMLQLALYAPRLTNADFRSYYIRPPLVSSWITPGGAYVLLPNEGPMSAHAAGGHGPLAARGRTASGRHRNPERHAQRRLG